MNFFLRTILILAASVAVSPASGTAQTTGTIIIAHGGDSVWNAGVMQVAREVNTGGPVEVSFLMGPGAATTRFQDAVSKLERAGASRIVVVPLLVSSHSGHYEQIRYLVGQTDSLDHAMEHHLHMGGIARANTELPLQLTPALDASAEMATVLAERALALVRAQGDVPSARALLIVGHGPNSADDYAAWMVNLRQVAAHVQAATGFRDVRVELVRDDAPAAVRAEAVLRTRELIELQTAATGKHVIVVPVLISKGAVSRDKLPADIAGTTSVYGAEPLLPHAAMARWVESRVRGASGSPVQGR